MAGPDRSGQATFRAKDLGFFHTGGCEGMGPSWASDATRHRPLVGTRRPVVETAEGVGRRRQSSESAWIGSIKAGEAA